MRLLELKLGVRVVNVIHDAGQILRAQRALRPTLAVIDRDIPGRDVFEVLYRAPRFSPPMRSMLLLSRLSDTDIDRAFAAGVNGCALKSDGVGQLRRALRRVLTGELGVTASVGARLAVRAGANPSRLTPTSLLMELTERELEILTHVAQGLAVKEIANLLSMSPKTVDGHKSRVMAKLGIHDRVRLSRYAIREGLVSEWANESCGHKPCAGA